MCPLCSSVARNQSRDDADLTAKRAKNAKILGVNACNISIHQRQVSSFAILCGLGDFARKHHIIQAFPFMCFMVLILHSLLCVLCILCGKKSSSNRGVLGEHRPTCAAVKFVCVKALRASRKNRIPKRLTTYNLNTSLIHSVMKSLNIMKDMRQRFWNGNQNVECGIPTLIYLIAFGCVPR